MKDETLIEKAKEVKRLCIERDGCSGCPYAFEDKTNDDPDCELNFPKWWDAPEAVQIQEERDRLNAEGELFYSASEIKVFDKCLEIIRSLQ